MKTKRLGRLVTTGSWPNYNVAVAMIDDIDITSLLKAWSQGDRHALERLMPLVYSQLRAQARRPNPDKS